MECDDQRARQRRHRTARAPGGPCTGGRRHTVRILIRSPAAPPVPGAYVVGADLTTGTGLALSGSARSEASRSGVGLRRRRPRRSAVRRGWGGPGRPRWVRAGRSMRRPESRRPARGGAALSRPPTTPCRAAAGRFTLRWSCRCGCPAMWPPRMCSRNASWSTTSCGRWARAATAHPGEVLCAEEPRSPADSRPYDTPPRRPVLRLREPGHVRARLLGSCAAERARCSGRPVPRRPPRPCSPPSPGPRPGTAA